MHFAGPVIRSLHVTVFVQWPEYFAHSTRVCECANRIDSLRAVGACSRKPCVKLLLNIANHAPDGLDARAKLLQPVSGVVETVGGCCEAGAVVRPLNIRVHVGDLFV